jgi:hypothetical protein
MNNRHGKNERDGQMALQSQCPVRWPASARSWPLWRTANRPVDPTCAPIVRFLFKFNWNKIKFNFIKNAVAKRRTHVTTTSRTSLADELPHEKCHKSHRGDLRSKISTFPAHLQNDDQKLDLRINNKRATCANQLHSSPSDRHAHVGCRTDVGRGRHPDATFRWKMAK